MQVKGSLQVKNGKYYMVVRVPDPSGGKKLRQEWRPTGISETGRNQRETRANRQAADLMLAELLQKLSREYAYGPDKDLIKSIESWLKGKKSELRPDTYEAYLSDYNKHIKPYFEPRGYSLKSVHPREILEYVQSKQEAGLSRNSIRKHLVILNGVFGEAVTMGELPSNPCASVRVKNRNADRFEGTAFDAATAKKLLEAVRGDPVEPAVYLGLYLGLRRSEVLGLRWKDVDMDNGIIHIRNTVVRFSTVSEMEKTKSRASRRNLFMPQALRNYLQTVWERQEEERKMFGRDFSGDEHVCQWADGTQYSPDYISQRFSKVLIRNGLPHIRFHDLRHTAGSLLINEGLSIKQVQAFLGHENASTTLDIYSHISIEGMKASSAVIDNLLA